ncbi:MAG: Rieske 2Fe-2S domain-containing protein [bacterium]
MAANFSLPFPDGWFAVCYCDELAPGEVKPFRYFERELIAFRSDDGEAHILDAFCPHLGAHLGYGGTVCGSTIRCPFHHWEFDGSGSCVKIPYSKKIPPKARLGAWPSCERNGLVLVWHHGGGEPPPWEVPEVAEATAEDWVDIERHEWTIRSQVQEITENGVDSAHFQFVHGTLGRPASEVAFDGPLRHARHEVRMQTPRGEITGVIESRTFGLGLSTVRYSGISETMQVLSTTPIDARHVVHRKSFRQPQPKGTSNRGAAAALIRNIVKQIGEDIPIWEHKTYRERPVLCDGDGPIGKYRQWCRQFYTEKP